MRNGPGIWEVEAGKATEKTIINHMKYFIKLNCGMPLWDSTRPMAGKLMLTRGSVKM